MTLESKVMVTYTYNLSQALNVSSFLIISLRALILGTMIAYNNRELGILLLYGYDLGLKGQGKYTLNLSSGS